MEIVFGNLKSVDILAIGVHPDDIELCCCGTVLSHISQGYKVGYCDLTQGEMGTRGTNELRLHESREAAKLAGVEFRVNLGMEDAFFAHNQANILSIAKVVRLSNAKVVLANAVHDRHPDHGRASKLISDACFYSGLAKIEIAGTVAHRPHAVYHYIQDRNLKADFVVDISNFVKEKMACIQCFSSQFYDPNSEEPNTPISGQDFMHYIESKQLSYARETGAEYAEGFNVERVPAIKNLFDLY
ncbi:MAG TPA: bacillithiol biosynthesis deacetylase BshB1 [Saprospiraceae bacterium]|nr:bacillithiol biosynthesis deacetylase BshB1 [Saprospiraceae bacterium]